MKTPKDLTVKVLRPFLLGGVSIPAGTEKILPYCLACEMIGAGKAVKIAVVVEPPKAATESQKTVEKAQEIKQEVKPEPKAEAEPQRKKWGGK